MSGATPNGQPDKGYMRPIRDTSELAAIHESRAGYVHNPDGQILHSAACKHVANMGPARKLFFATFEAAAAHLSADPRRRWTTCPVCLTDRPAGRAVLDSTPTAAPSLPASPALAVDEFPNGFAVDAPAYVPFEPRTAELRELRAEIRSRLRRLQAEPGELLHGCLAGALPGGADIENALLYNIDQSGAAMGAATRHGVRFERDRLPPATPGVRYRYDIVPLTSGFATWKLGRRLARIGPIELGSTAPRCTAVWWALTRGDIEAAPEPLTPQERFAVRLDVQGPTDSLRPEPVKALVDGVVCALQAHLDASSVAEPASRIATALGWPAEEIAAALMATDRAVLGGRRRLVHPWRAKVQWSPDDHLCVAGELVFRKAERWRLTGQVLTAR